MTRPVRGNFRCCGFRLTFMAGNIFSASVTFGIDYQIYVILHGRAAKAYFKAQRMIQQACVDTCNREGWVIPFT